jgi:hypothetical protein
MTIDIDDYVRRLVDQAPPLTAATRARLSAIITPVRSREETKPQPPRRGPTAPQTSTVLADC